MVMVYQLRLGYFSIGSPFPPVIVINPVSENNYLRLLETFCVFFSSGAASGLNPKDREYQGTLVLARKTLCRFENKLYFFSSAIGSKAGFFMSVSVVLLQLLSCHGTANNTITCFVSLMRDHRQE
jgi:hypothetical protein